MDGATLRSRLLALCQKSRRAERIYETLPRGVEQLQGNREEGDLSDLQLNEWRAVSAELVRQLSIALGLPNQRDLSYAMTALRERFEAEARVAESELARDQRELISSAERGDFVRATSLARTLVSRKARVQACSGALHELDQALGGVSSGKSAPAAPEVIPLTESDEMPASAKIIKFTRVV